jgi:hypothetical protein
MKATFSPLLAFALGLIANLPLALAGDRDPAPSQVYHDVHYNLRQLHAAARQHMLEHGVVRVEGRALLGPGGYVPRLKPIQGEDYAALVFDLEEKLPIRVTTRDGLVVDLAKLPPEPAAPRSGDPAEAPLTKAEKIRRNLRMLSSAADQAMLEENLARVTTERLVGPGRYVRSLVVHDGEDYSRLVFTADGSLPIRVTTKDGYVVSLEE